VPDVNVELTMNRLSRDVRLVLLVYGVFGEFATATLRTALRQWSIPAFINLLGDGSPCLRPVILTGLAARLSGNSHLRLTKRSRLSLACTLRFFERLL
jgi:hypothetical protein